MALDPAVPDDFLQRRPLAVMAKSIGVALSALFLGSCFPYATSYVHLDGSGVTHLREMCRDFGAPIAVAYHRAGVGFEISLHPGHSSRSKTPFLKLRAPPKLALSMPERRAHLLSEGRTIDVPLNFKGASRDLDGRLEATIELRGLSEYWFEFAVPAQSGSSGTLKLPTIYVDGTAVESPLLSFERRLFAGAVPLNC